MKCLETIKESMYMYIDITASLKKCHFLCRGKDGQISELQGLQNIELLNLEGNQLSDWKTILRLGHLPR